MSLQSSDLVINGLSGDRFTFWTARFRIAGIVVVVNANNGSSGNSVDLAEFSGRFARSDMDRNDGRLHGFLYWQRCVVKDFVHVDVGSTASVPRNGHVFWYLKFENPIKSNLLKKSRENKVSQICTSFCR